MRKELDTKIDKIIEDLLYNDIRAFLQDNTDSGDILMIKTEIKKAIIKCIKFSNRPAAISRKNLAPLFTKPIAIGYAGRGTTFSKNQKLDDGN